MKYFLPILFLFLFFHLSAQRSTKATISNVQFDYDLQNDYVLISFQLNDAKPDAVFRINVDGKKVQNGESLKINSVSGDTGSISGNGMKTIIWGQRKDGYVLDEDIGITVNAITRPEIPSYKHLLRSAIMPGLGDYQIRNGKHYGLYGVFAYGLLASSIYLNSTAIGNYNNYKASYDINESDKLFSQTLKQQQLSYLVAGVAVAIWVADISGVFLKTKKLKNEITPENSRYYYALSQKPIAGFAPAKHLNTKNSYERAVENGDKWFVEKNYAAALNEFEQAEKFNTSDASVKNKIAETKKIIAEINAKEEQFISSRAEGDSLFNIKKYNDAKVAYQNALNIKPENFMITERITEIEIILEEIHNDSLYHKKLPAAEAALKNNDYENARNLFVELQMLKGNEEYPRQKIIEIDSILAVLEQMRIDEEYKTLIAKADLDFENKSYSKAKAKYEEAIKLKPSEDYPKFKIATIINILELAEAGSKRSLSDLYERNKNAVFLIYTADNNKMAQGSGFFITSDGIGVSNYHVYNGYDAAIIYTEGDKKYKIEKILDSDKEKDYIIFKVINYANTYFDHVKIAKNNVKIGEEVFAIGNPEGLEKTLSKGIVSGLRSEAKYIQTDAPITHGSSGGPLFNIKGEVIGITTLGKQEGSLFFALNIKELFLNRFMN